jgi:outer membrane protein assembly factor BamB
MHATRVARLPTVHITVFCPECQSRFQLNADLRGRKMRCPNAACQQVFVVREASSGPPKGGVNGPRAADSRGQLVVPLQGDRPSRAPRSPAPVEELDWRDAPPPVQTDEDAAANGDPDHIKPLAPARIRDWDQPAPTLHWRRLILFGLILFTVSLAGYGVWYGVRALAFAENNLRAEAAKDYAGGKFRAAANKYRDLATKYGNGEHGPEYRFLAELSDLQDAAASPVADPAAALAKAESFAKQFDVRDPQFKDRPDRRKAVIDALAAIAGGFADAADAAAATDDGETTVPPLLEQGKKAFSLVALFGGPVADLRGRLENANQALAQATKRRQAIAEVLKLLRAENPDLDAARRLAEQIGVAHDASIRQEIARVENARLREVTYEPLNKQPQRTVPAGGPSVLLLETASASTRAPEEVVVAVARGLLYALDARDGRRVWACRVGLDSGELPVRLRANGDGPELILVAGSDPPGLTARDALTGAVVWHQPLDAPPLGRPVQNAGQLFVPTAGPRGWIYDLDSRTGLLHGRFLAGQRLAAGGAFDPATQRLYVPAHGQGVFVFSYGVEGPKCEGLLKTNHPAGSLRGEPIVVSADEGLGVPRYLVLGQADGLEAMTLRAFRLLDAPTMSPAPAEVRLSGWSWFPPYHDPETIALVTDSGAIGLFGIQQKGDEDEPLFQLLADKVSGNAGGPEITEFGADASSGRRPARGQLVHASETGFWVLADGVLRHWRLGLSRRAGRQLTPAFDDGIRLGSPLHAAQVSADGRRLFLVTQTDSPPTIRATAVDSANGDSVWQKPLGLATQGDPVMLGGAVVVLDQSGGVYRFDPALHSVEANEAWQAGGREITKPSDALVGTPYLLPAADGESAWAVLVTRSSSGDGLRLTLRRIAADWTVTSGSVALPAPLIGKPALGPNAIVLPLANGQLARVTLDVREPTISFGPTWRPLGARPDARGPVVHWNGDEFIVSDGGRRLLRLTWPTGPKYELDKDRPVELAQRLIGAPTKMRDGTIAVADAGGTVSLIRGERPTIVRAWRLGPVTAGPWTVGDKLAVVVDRRKLIWLNPETDQPLWTNGSAGDGIESPPRIIDGKLVLADLAGHFVALDPATGKNMGGGYQFAAEAAPAAAVIEFGPGRLFAPMTDGTVLLLPLTDLTR